MPLPYQAIFGGYIYFEGTEAECLAYVADNGVPGWEVKEWDE